MNILVLDDDRSVCEVFKSRLELDNYVCMTAVSIEEAWSKSKILKFDVLIADLRLSGDQRGDVFAKEFKKVSPWTRIFLLTGNPNPDIVQGLSVDQVMIKPIDFDEFIHRLGNNQYRPREVDLDSVKLDDRDMQLIMQLVNKVVEHTNIVATTQSLISENLEELASSQERHEDKMTYIFEMLKKVDDSGILHMYSAVSGFVRQAVSKVFWAVIVLIGMFILKGPILTFLNEVLLKK